MKLLLFLSLVILTLVACKGEVGKPCTSQDQCEADECCQIVNIIVASRKRQLIAQAIGGPNTSGTCEKLKKELESCSNIAVMNGYCGCASGLSCTPIPRDQFDALRTRRREFPSHCTAN